MRELKIDNKKWKVAESFDELSLPLLYVLYHCMKRNESIHAVKTKMIIATLGIKVKKKKYLYGTIKGVKGIINAEQISMLAELYDFLFTEADENGHCDMDITLCRFPNDFKNSFNPGFALCNVNYGQFQYITTFLQAVKCGSNEEREKALDGIIATLFIKDTTSADELPDIKPLLKQIRDFSIPLYDKVNFLRTITLWYVAGSMKYMAEKFPLTFEGGESESVDEPFIKNMQIIEIITNGDVAKRDAVRDSNLYDVLHTLETRIEQSKKQNKP